MNELNSVLIEGNVCSIDELSQIDQDHSFLCFVITNKRNRLLPDGNSVASETTFRITTYDQLAQDTAEYLYLGRGVRIVGRLDADNIGVFIEAEHVEFKPLFTKNGKDNLILVINQGN